MKKNINPMLLCDFYKTVHSDMINPQMTKSMSYYTPRMSRVNRWDKVVMFGVQMFCKTWLIDYFNENFFRIFLCKNKIFRRRLSKNWNN